MLFDRKKINKQFCRIENYLVNTVDLNPNTMLQ